MSKDKSHLRHPLLLFFGVFLFTFLKWLFALMCMGHLSNAGRRPQWLEIISEFELVFENLKELEKNEKVNNVLCDKIQWKMGRIDPMTSS